MSSSDKDIKNLLPEEKPPASPESPLNEDELSDNELEAASGGIIRNLPDSSDGEEEPPLQTFH